MASGAAVFSSLSSACSFRRNLFTPINIVRTLTSFQNPQRRQCFIPIRRGFSCSSTACSDVNSTSPIPISNNCDRYFLHPLNSCTICVFMFRFLPPTNLDRALSNSTYNRKCTLFMPNFISESLSVDLVLRNVGTFSLSVVIQSGFAMYYSVAFQSF